MAARCVVRGSINNDEYFYVKTIARPGETLSSEGYERRIGGKGANQAVAILRAGGRVTLYGTIGDDGMWIKNAMRALGMDDSGILVDSKPTGRALIQVARSGENSIILFPGANHSTLHEDAWSAQSAFPEASHVLLQNEIHMSSTKYALDAATREGRTTVTIFNPSPVPPEDEIREFSWHKVHWLIVNRGEAEDILTALSDHQSGPDLNPGNGPISELMARLSSQAPLSRTNIICTLGGDGVVAFMPAIHRDQSKNAITIANHEPDHNQNDFVSLLYVPAVKLQGAVRDTTGAGDCFTGYFVQGLMEYGPDAVVGNAIGLKDVEKILKICVQAAGMCCERQGTIDSIPTRAEMEARMSSN